jgi:predicted homoserine dehydrogenase-like protein
MIVDAALEKRREENRPVRVAMVGAGFMGRGISRQIVNQVPGMELVAISNRTLSAARRAYEEAGAPDHRVVAQVGELEDAIANGVPSITEDASLLCRAEGVDAIIEVTGTVEFGAGVAVEAIEYGKHVVLMNAELDGTVGPILKVRADRAGVVFTNADGDQPGVIMNLYRFVKGIGVRPVLCGNIKGLHDPYRNPTTQESFARKWAQEPTMVTSFADGTKISFEQAIVANATGMRVAKRGMMGLEVPAGTPIEQAADRFSQAELLRGPGLVDYVVGAVPSPGVFVLGTHDDPVQRQYLSLYKLGDGPVYCFYTPYHLCHFEVPNTVARAVLFGDAAIAPIGPPIVDVVAAAKVDLRTGQTIDGIGGYSVYGLAENHDIVARDRLVPMGLAEGCRVLRDVKRDIVLTYGDLELPEVRLSDRLRREQSEHFATLTPSVSASRGSDIPNVPG